MQEEESHPHRQVQDCNFDGRQPDQEEERGKEGRSVRMIAIIFKYPH